MGGTEFACRLTSVITVRAPRPRSRGLPLSSGVFWCSGAAAESGGHLRNQPNDAQWHFAPGEPGMLDTAALVNGESVVHVVPGAGQDLPTATSCATTTAVSAAGGGVGTAPQALAFSGVEVWPYAIPAVGLIAVGAALLVFTRRRRSAH